MIKGPREGIVFTRKAEKTGQKMSKVSKDTPLAEITLRKYEKPHEGIDRRELVKKLCLSVGLLQPGDSRDVVVDVLAVIMSNGMLDSKEIEDKVIGLSKQQNRYLRNMLIESSWLAIRTDPALLQAYGNLVRRMSKQKAIIRIAKKLLSRIMYVWRNEKHYVCAVVS